MQEMNNNEINDQFYPALYKAANIASINAQSAYLLTVFVYLLLLIIAAALSVYGIQDKSAAIGAAFVIIVSIFVSFSMILKKDEDTWYRARAVAESIKTSSWRFMMRADPFSEINDIQIVKTDFRELLKSIISEHKELGHELGGDVSCKEQITDFMCEIRNMTLEKRIDFYRKKRIDEQRNWYAKKSAKNKKASRSWFIMFILCQLLAIIFVIFRVAYPNVRYWPTEIFLVCAGAILTWIQVKRFRELTSAYGIAAHEIGIIRGELEHVSTEDAFGEFVTNSESAFSREHTQWLARKNVL